MLAFRPSDTLINHDMTRREQEKRQLYNAAGPLKPANNSMSTGHPFPRSRRSEIVPNDPFGISSLEADLARKTATTMMMFMNASMTDREAI